MSLHTLGFPRAHAEYNRAWRNANLDRVKIHTRCKALRCAGLTGKGTEPMRKWEVEFEKQGRCCKICRAKSPGRNNGWHTDHDHKTGKFRGIICHACNLTLGNAKDDLNRLRRCVEYLEKGGRIHDRTKTR